MKVGFDGKIRLEFHGAMGKFDGGLFAYRDLNTGMDRSLNIMQK